MRWRGHSPFGLLWLVFVLGAGTPVAARQEAAILVDHATGEVLTARNADERVFPASLTKMMTLYLTFRSLEAGQLTPSSRLKVSARAAAMPPTKLGLKAGATIRVEDAILALVTKSANDAASVLAENLGGSEDGFARLMTRTARQLGMSRTVFRNASGLPDAQQRSTARDLARLARRLIEDYPGYYGYFSRRSFSYAGRTHGNHNRLLSSYGGMDGLKTGYTRASGFNLAASAVRDGRRLVAVVVGGPTARARDASMVELLDAGFGIPRRQRSPAPTLVASPLPSPPRPESAEAAVLAVAEEPRSVAADAGQVLAASLESPPPAGDAPVFIPAARPERAQAVASVEAESARPGKAAREAKGKRASAKKQPNRRPYGVQVGAFRKSGQARQALKLAVGRAPDLLRGTFASVGSSQKAGGGTMFRATLVGLSKADADSVCRRLKRHRQDCMTIQAGPLAVANR
jgi:D-alanyl-D-alanine carboxypeptidase